MSYGIDAGTYLILASAQLLQTGATIVAQLSRQKSEIFIMN